MKNLKIVALIPARMAASRFPNKPLANILSLPMIEHVRRRVNQCKALSEVYVATCDEAIKKEVEKYGGKVIMTRDTHERCTDRIEEAAHKIDADIVVNIQGDEPAVMQESILELIEPFKNNPNLQCTNIVNPVTDLSDLNNQNVVKAVLSLSNKILFLSRAAIPSREIKSDFKYYKQTGIMAFRKNFLHKFSQLAPTPLEIKESIDMLRLLEHDYAVQAVISDYKTIGIDVPDQIKMIEDYLMTDPVQRKIYDSIK